MATNEAAHPGIELVKKYFSAYKEHDADGMEACMDPEFKFKDPAFPDLDSKLFLYCRFAIYNKYKA
jgi:ketosteroid isomerase-like protein